MAATITACTSATSVNRAVLVQKTPVVRVSYPVLGLPVMAKVGKVRCSMEGKGSVQDSGSLKVDLSLWLVAAASSPAAMALVEDERLSTE